MTVREMFCKEKNLQIESLKRKSAWMRYITWLEAKYEIALRESQFAVPSDKDTFEHISRFLTDTLSEREKVLIRVSLNFVKSELQRGIADNARRTHDGHK